MLGVLAQDVSGSLNQVPRNSSWGVRVARGVWEG